MYVAGSAPYPQTSTTPISAAQVTARDTPRANIEQAIDTAAAASRCVAPIDSFQGPTAMIDAVQTQTTALTAQLASLAPAPATAAAIAAGDATAMPPVVVPLNVYDFGGAQPQNCNGANPGMGDYLPAWGGYSPVPSSCGLFSSLSAFASNNPLLVTGAALLTLLGMAAFVEGK